MSLLFLVLQASQPSAAPPPDIQLEIGATARRVTVVNRGRTSLEMRASMNGRDGQTNVIEVDAPELPQGETRLENADVRIRGEARIPAPGRASRGGEPAPPQ